MEQAKICVVTLCLNDEVGLEKTLESVQSQSSPPSRSIVIDGSTGEKRTAARGIAAKFGSEYVWLEPTGIYPAMRFSLELLDPLSHVLFLNSGDCFHSSESISAFIETHKMSDGNVKWMIGGLAIRDGEHQRSIYTPPTVDSDVFLEMIKKRQLWLPHPSTLYLVSALRECKPFEGSYQIASDFGTGVRMAKKHGAPVIVDSVVADFFLGGISSSSPYRIVLETFLVRAIEFGPSVWIPEFARLTKYLLRNMGLLPSFLDKTH